MLISALTLGGDNRLSAGLPVDENLCLPLLIQKNDLLTADFTDSREVELGSM